MITVSAIKRATAEHYQVPQSRMTEPYPKGQGQCGRNAYDVAHARQVAMTLAFRLTDHSKSRIGDFFGGRDHTTVGYAVQEVEKRQQLDPAVRAALRQITFEVLAS
jgi:chromosomal replication initiator protein